MHSINLLSCARKHTHFIYLASKECFRVETTGAAITQVQLTWKSCSSRKAKALNGNAIVYKTHSGQTTNRLAHNLPRLPSAVGEKENSNGVATYEVSLASPRTTAGRVVVDGDSWEVSCASCNSLPEMAKGLLW